MISAEFTELDRQIASLATLVVPDLSMLRFTTKEERRFIQRFGQFQRPPYDEVVGLVFRRTGIEAPPAEIKPYLQGLYPAFDSLTNQLPASEQENILGVSISSDAAVRIAFANLDDEIAGIQGQMVGNTVRSCRNFGYFVIDNAVSHWA